MHVHRRLLPVVLGSGLLLSLAAAAAPAEAQRSAITTTRQGTDLTIVVHGVTDYCSTNARTDVIRRTGAIRIVRDRPTVVSRCVTEKDLTFVVHDVTAGSYTISYEQIPLIAPARFLTLAQTRVNVRE
ncbi:MAG: hypothetical protein JWP97_1470 [Labilithrix sp.]|nr:hypothetical protein [Labilithrix sp.]